MNHLSKAMMYTNLGIGSGDNLVRANGNDGKFSAQTKYGRFEPTVIPSAKKNPIWAEPLRQSGYSSSEPSDSFRWRLTAHLALIPRVPLHITLP